MAEARKWPAGLGNRQGLSSDQAEARSPLSSTGAEGSRPRTHHSSAAVTWVAPGAHSASGPGSLQPEQREGTPDAVHPDRSQVPPGSQANRSLPSPLAGQGSPHFPSTSSSGNLRVSLCNQGLWRHFSTQQTEMVLTKQGRAMFPFLLYRIQGMDPRALYRVSVQVGRLDQSHWRYQRGGWLPAYAEEDDKLPANRFYQHPDSPNTGAHWMHTDISFKKLKLTNNEAAPNNGSQPPILLKSLHKYQPTLLIEEVSNTNQPTLASSSSRHTFTFPGTDFIAVTAYQNPALTRLKIQNNPYARAFRGRPSCPGPSLQKPPPAGQGSDHCTSAPPSWLPSNYPGRLQGDPGQDKDCHFMQASQPPSGHLSDSRDSSRTTSRALPSTMEGALNPEPPPSTFPNPMSSCFGTHAPSTQGNWAPCLATCTSNGNLTHGLQPESPKTQPALTASEEEEGLQEPLCPSSSRCPSDVSHLRQSLSKKRSFSPVDPAHDSLDVAWKTREEEAMWYLLTNEANDFSRQEAISETSCHLEGLQGDNRQAQGDIIPNPCNYIQETQSPAEYLSDLNALIPHFLPSCPAAMPREARPDTHITQGNWPSSLSNCTSHVNSMECFCSGSPKPQQGSTGMEEMERLQEQLCPSSSRSPSDVSHLRPRTSKETCSSPVDPAKDSSTSTWKVREEELKCLIASESSGNSSQETLSQTTCYPLNLQGDPGPREEKMNSTPGNSNLPSDSFDFDPTSLLQGLFPWWSPTARLQEQCPDTLIPQGNCPPSPSNCTSNVHRVECLHPGHSKLQQGSNATEEEERLQEPLCPSSSRAPSDVSHLGQSLAKKRCFSPVDSAKDFSASAWKAREQEDRCLLATKCLGYSSQGAISEASRYPVVLQEETGQVNEKKPTHCDSMLETQPPPEPSFDAGLSDVIHRVSVSTSAAMPSHSSPNMPLTQESWPSSLSPCISNGSHSDTFQSGSAKPQQEDPFFEELERLEEQLCPSSSWSPSYLSHLD